MYSKRGAVVSPGAAVETLAPAMLPGSQCLCLPKNGPDILSPERLFVQFGTAGGRVVNRGVE